jgi:hypothetical protein
MEDCTIVAPILPRDCISGRLMKKAISWILVGFLGLPFMAVAGSSALNAHIKNLQINKGYGNFVFINIDVTPTGAPPCENGSWEYTLSLSNPGDTQLYAMLLTAYAAGSPINIGGAGACNDVGFVESATAIQLTQ